LCTRTRVEPEPEPEVACYSVTPLSHATRDVGDDLRDRNARLRDVLVAAGELGPD